VSSHVPSCAPLSLLAAAFAPFHGVRTIIRVRDPEDVAITKLHRGACQQRRTVHGLGEAPFAPCFIAMGSAFSALAVSSTRSVRAKIRNCRGRHLHACPGTETQPWGARALQVRMYTRAVPRCRRCAWRVPWIQRGQSATGRVDLHLRGQRGLRSRGRAQGRRGPRAFNHDTLCGGPAARSLG
jgi:hypothetical protein